MANGTANGNGQSGKMSVSIGNILQALILLFIGYGATFASTLSEDVKSMQGDVATLKANVSIMLTRDLVPRSEIRTMIDAAISRSLTEYHRPDKKDETR